MNAIETKMLTKRYGDLTAVDSLDLQIREGELFSLLGVNGAGKTTTIKMLSCVSRPTAGDALILGRSIIREPGEVKKVIAASPQETAVAPNLTGRENLELMAGIYGFSQAETEEKIRNLSDLLSLDGCLSKRAGKLSGGWQRRLSIAMALIGEPKVLFLDEPTLGMDVIARCELWDVVRALKGKITIILTTHYMEEAETLSDRIAIMKNGKLRVVGTAGEIMEKAGTEKFEDAFVRIVKGEGL